MALAAWALPWAAAPLLWSWICCTICRMQKGSREAQIPRGAPCLALGSLPLAGAGVQPAPRAMTEESRDNPHLAEASTQLSRLLLPRHEQSRRCPCRHP